MATRHPVIISCAITGSVHTPSMSEHLPVTPDEIAASAIGSLVFRHPLADVSGRPVLRRSWRAMGTVASLHIHDDLPAETLDVVVASVAAELERLEAMFSTFRSDSDISAINRGELHPLDAPGEVVEVLVEVGGQVAVGARLHPAVQHLGGASGLGRCGRGTHQEQGEDESRACHGAPYLPSSSTR